MSGAASVLNVTAPTVSTSRPSSRLRRVSERVPRRLRFGLGLAAVLEVPLLVWWLSFFPGLGNYDSVQYSWEVLTSHWSTDHSVLYDAFVWLSFQISGGIALLTFVQTFVLAAVLAFAANSLVRLGVRRRWATAAAVAVVVLPSLGSFTIYVWKDVIFAAAEVWVMAWTMQLVALRREDPDGWASSPRGRRMFAWLFLAFLSTALLRNNGFLVVLLDGAVLTALLSGGRRLAAAAAAAAVAVFMALTYGLFPNVGVQSPPSDLVLGPAYDDIAVVYHSYPGDFSAKEVQLLKKVAPLHRWDYAGANCWNADALTLAVRFHRDVAAQHARALFGLWRRVLQRHPVKVLQARWCRGTIAWSPWPGPSGRGDSAFPNVDIPANLFGWWPERLADVPRIHQAFQPDPPVPALRSAARSYVKTSSGIGGEWILWRGATWCYLAYVTVGIVAWRRREWPLVTVAAVAFANQVTVLVDNPAQLIRYMEGCIYVGVLLLPLLTTLRPDPAPADER